MMRLSVLIVSALAISGKCVLGGDTDQGTIAVEVKGTLADVMFVIGPDDDSPRLAMAFVQAAGQKLLLDFSQCVAARRELIQRYANPGSTASLCPEVVVKGRLEFRPLAEGKAAAPVVVVESLVVGNPCFLK